MRSEINRILNLLDNSNPIHEKKLEKTLADLYEVEIANLLNHDFQDGAGYDGISKSNRKFEYKSVLRCTSSSITISNLNDKEDVILYVGPNILSEKEHWFFFPKEVLENPELQQSPKNLVDKHLSRGKLMGPVGLFEKKENGEWSRDTIKKRFFRRHEVDFNTLYDMVQ